MAKKSTAVVIDELDQAIHLLQATKRRAVVESFAWEVCVGNAPAKVYAEHAVDMLRKWAGKIHADIYSMPAGDSRKAAAERLFYELGRGIQALDEAVRFADAHTQKESTNV